MDPVNKLQGANKLRSSEQFVFIDNFVQRQNGKLVPSLSGKGGEGEKKIINQLRPGRLLRVVLKLSSSCRDAALRFGRLHQIVLLQVELQDGILDGGEDEADVFRVCRASKVRIDDFVTVRIQVDKHLQDELPPRLSVSLGA